MKKQGIEFYIGLFIWLLEILVSYSLWLTGNDADIQPSMSPLNIAVPAALFFLFLVGFLTCHGILFQHRASDKTRMIGLLLASASTLGLSLFFYFGMVALLATLLIIHLVSFVSQKRALLIAVLVPVVCVSLDVLLGKTFEFTIIIVYVTFNLLALLIRYQLLAEHTAKLESEQLVRELRATQILLSATSKKAERLRIARDLHDSLGHQLTALSLQLEVANHVAEGEKVKHVRQAQAISGSLLASVRAAVSEIRQDKDLELRDALLALIRGIPDLKVDLSMHWDESMADAQMVEVLFRCVQEALTNTARHAGASHCNIEISNDEQYLLLSVKDDGRDTDEIKPGNGLKGLEERVRNIDGQLNYENASSGFTLAVKLPIDR